jgi:hypothetical protein
MRDSKLASTLSVFAIVFSTAAIYYSLRGGPSPSMNTAPHEAAGWVLGQQTLSLLEPGGRISVIARDTTAFENPASDVLLAGFKKALSKKDKKIDSISLIQADPLRPVEVPSGDFYELIRNTPKGSVIVSLLGPPMLTDSQRTRLNQVNPGVVAFCSGSIPEMLDLRVLFEKKLLQVAIISRRQPQQSSRSTDLQGWFDRFFVCVTPSNLNALSAGATTP